MPDDTKCPSCGRDIPPESPGGQCPYCLLQLGGGSLADSAAAPSIGRDRNLLFGVLALQLRFVRPEEFLDAASGWATDPSRDVARRLVEAGALDEKKRGLVDELVRAAIDQHQGDEHRTLETFGGESAVAEQLSGIDRTERTREAATKLGIPLDVEDVDSDDVSAVWETPGRYTRTSEYTRGGMGRILLVHDEYLSRDIALKELIPPSDPTYPALGGKSPAQALSSMVVRFLREAKVTGQLEHPSIVPVYELGRRPNGTLYYTMKLVRGQTLAQALRSVKTLRERLTFLSHFVDMCQAIGYAHSRNVVHRDVKPSNVMIGEFGETVVIDWGLAKVVGQPDIHEKELRETWSKLRGKVAPDPAKTAPGTRLGTPHYMSPEQAKGHINEVDQRADVFALGAVLYELLTGRVPFDGKTTEAVFEQVVEAAPRPVRELAPDVPPELASVCAKAMAKDPADRYQDAKELADDIERFLTGAVVHAYDYSAREVLSRFYKRHRTLINATAAAVIALLALGVFSYVSIRLARDEAVVARDNEAAARAGAVQARDAEALARDDAERTGYVNQVRLAYAYMQQNNYARGREVLWATEPTLRNWEWGYLINLAHKELYSIPGYQNFSISPDGSTLAVTAQYEPVGIIDASNGSILREIPVPAARTNETHGFSQDGSRFLVTVDSSRVLVCDVRTGDMLLDFVPHGMKLNSATYNPDATTILTSGEDGAAKIWDAETGELLQTLEADGQPVSHASFHADGALVSASVGDAAVYIWNLGNGETTVFDDVETRGRYDISPNGALFARANGRDVEVWTVPGQDLVHTLYAAHASIRTVAFDNAGERLLVAGSEGLINIWDPSTGEKIMSTFTNANLPGTAWSPDGRYILTSPYKSNPQIRDAATGNVVTELVQSRYEISPWFGFFPDARRAITSVTGLITVWDATSSPGQRIVAEQSYTIDAKDRQSSEIDALSIDHAGVTLAIHDSRHELNIVDLSAQRHITTLAGFSLPVAHRSAVSPDGSLVVAALDDFLPMTFSVQSGEIMARRAGHNGPIAAVQFNLTGREVVTAAMDGSIAFWDPSTGETRLSFVHPHRPTTLAINATDTLLLVGDAEGALALYDAASGAEMRHVDEFENDVRAVAWHPDGTEYFASARDGGVVRSWNAQDGEPRRTLAGHTAGPRAMIFRSESSRLLTAATDSVRAWDLGTNQELVALSGPGHAAFAALPVADTGILSYDATNSRITLWEPVPWKDIHEAPDPKRAFDRYRDEQRGRRTAPLIIDSHRNIIAVTTRNHLTIALTRLRDLLQSESAETPVDLSGLLIEDGPRLDTVRRIALRHGDRITAIDSVSIDSRESVIQRLDNTILTLNEQPSVTITLTIMRSDIPRVIRYALEQEHAETRRVPLTRAEATESFATLANSLRTIPILKSGSQDSAAKIGEPVTGDDELSGFFVPNLPAAEDHRRAVGLQLYLMDRITALNDQPVTNYDEFTRAIEAIAEALQNGEIPEIVMDVERGEFQRIRLIYDVQ